MEPNDWLDNLRIARLGIEAAAARLCNYQDAFAKIGNETFANYLTEEITALNAVAYIIDKATGEIVTEIAASARQATANMILATMAIFPKQED